jgi:hypothetical protein
MISTGKLVGEKQDRRPEVTSESMVGMDKGDWEFAISLAIGLFGFLGLDWKVVGGRLQMPHLNVRNSIVAALLLISISFSATGWYQLRHIDRLHWTMKDSDMEVIYGKTYRNEKVEMDGKKFDHCTFENVTFVYHALAPTGFNQSNFEGSEFYLETDNDAAKGMLILEQIFESMPGHKMFYQGGIDPNGNLAPLPPAFSPQGAPDGNKK